MVLGVVEEEEGFLSQRKKYRAVWPQFLGVVRLRHSLRDCNVHYVQ